MMTIAESSSGNGKAELLLLGLHFLPFVKDVVGSGTFSPPSIILLPSLCAGDYGIVNITALVGLLV